jgi:hypothetical protein
MFDENFDGFGIKKFYMNRVVMICVNKLSSMIGQDVEVVGSAPAEYDVGEHNGNQRVEIFWRKSERAFGAGQ